MQWYCAEWHTKCATFRIFRLDCIYRTIAKLIRPNQSIFFSHMTIHSLCFVSFFSRCFTWLIVDMFVCVCLSVCARVSLWFCKLSPTSSTNPMALKMKFELIHRAPESDQGNTLKEEEALILFISICFFFHRCQCAFYVADRFRALPSARKVQLDFVRSHAFVDWIICGFEHSLSQYFRA